jgi:hypothetical protein
VTLLFFFPSLFKSGKVKTALPRPKFPLSAFSIAGQISLVRDHSGYEPSYVSTSCQLICFITSDMDELLERECRSASPVIRPDKRTSMDILGAVIPLYYSASHAPASGVLLPVAFRPPQQTNNLACVISFHRLCLTWMSFSIVRPSLAVQPRQWPILLIAFLWRSSIPESSHFRSNCRSSDATFFCSQCSGF